MYPCICPIFANAIRGRFFLPRPWQENSLRQMEKFFGRCMQTSINMSTVCQTSNGRNHLDCYHEQATRNVTEEASGSEEKAAAAEMP
jgi:hypothetical protein